MSTAIVAALLVGLFQLIICGTFAVCFRIWADRKQAEVERRVDAVVREWTEHEPGKPNKLAEVMASLGSVVGAAAAQSIMASLSADASHTARAANAASDELQAIQNPVLGLLTGGKRGKGAAVRQLVSALGSLMGSSGHNGDNGGSSPPRSTSL